MKKNLVFKILAIGIFLYFSVISFTPIILGQENTDFLGSNTILKNYLIDPYNGNLSGYVNDSDMNPLEGARVRVSFHGTYEEDYTDSSGYYHVTNIPICWCMKNCTASKEGYSSEEVWLSIYENTKYDFVLKILNNPPTRPIINGPKIGRYGQKLNFTINCSDPDGDDIKYIIKWGDGKTDTTSFFQSGTKITVSHTYHGVHYDQILFTINERAENTNIFLITARAEDTNGLIGPKETFKIKITRFRAAINPVFFRLFEMFPKFQRILNYMFWAS